MKAHDYPQVYEWLGINLSKLGCLMLDVENISIAHWLMQDGVTSYETGFPYYIAKNPERFWINGFVGDKAHVTLLYGFLVEAEQLKPHIQQVLKGVDIREVEIESIGYFDSPYQDEPYYCIVAHVNISPELHEAHTRLQFLPHLKTFPGYKPHITIAYIKKNEMIRDSFIEDLRREFVGKKLKTLGLNFGGNK